jgi:hypothetical protein
MYRGNNKEGIPYQLPDEDDKWEDGVLTTCGCFDRHNVSREEMMQDNYRHQPLEDYPYKDMYDTFKFFEQRYQFKEKFSDAVVLTDIPLDNSQKEEDE